MTQRRSTGFTLIEVLVTLGIFILLAAATVQIFLTSHTSEQIIFDQLDAQGEARRALETFTDEVRGATYSSIGAYPIELASPTEFIFYSNVDSDSYIERVHYFLNGTTLEEGITKPSGNPLSYNTSTETVTDVVHYVANTSTPIFTYYDQNYDGTDSSTPLSDPINLTQIRMIGVNLRLDKNPTASPAALTVETQAEMRNLKSN